MTTTASQNLTHAHGEVYQIAEKASLVLTAYEGTGATLSYGDIAAQIGLDLRSLGRTDTFLAYLSIDAAVDFRGWKNISEPGESARFQKPPKVTTRRRSASEQASRKARASR